MQCDIQTIITQQLQNKIMWLNQNKTLQKSHKERVKMKIMNYSIVGIYQTLSNINSKVFDFMLNFSQMYRCWHIPNRINITISLTFAMNTKLKSECMLKLIKPCNFWFDMCAHQNNISVTNFLISKSLSLTVFILIKQYIIYIM